MTALHFAAVILNSLNDIIKRRMKNLK